MRVDDEKAALCALGGAEGVKSNLVAPLLLAEQKLGTTLSLSLALCNELLASCSRVQLFSTVHADLNCK